MSDAMRIRNDLLAAGWLVAVHNDYRQGGVLQTFWLMTHPCGIYIKAEGENDYACLCSLERQASQKMICT